MASIDVEAYRELFPYTKHYTFFNHAAISPLNRRVTQVIHEKLEQMESMAFDHLSSDIERMYAQCKERIVTLIGAASTDEVVAITGTATGINIAANSLPLRAGDNVLVVDGDYPSNIYAWLNLAPRGILVKWVPLQEGGIDLAALEARIDNHTRVVALSSAMFATGFKNDLMQIGAICKQRKLYFVVDGIQTLGAFPLDVQECNIDFLACGSHKWLLSVPGMGFLYCRHELLEHLQLGAYVGAMSTVDPWNFLDYNFTLQPSAERFTLGTRNLLDIAGLNASLGLIHEVGIANITERIITLTDTLIADLQARGYRVLSNLDPRYRSGIVLVEVPQPQKAHDTLLVHNVVTSVRGWGLRISPHFYNTEDEILRVGEMLDNI